MAVEEEIIRQATQQSVTISVAEACTGGLIGSLLVDVPGSSRVFAGGIVAYASAPKRELLDVPAEILQHGGAVSGECVVAMALGARSRFKTTVAIAASGIAGPAGGTSEKPAGTVFLAFATPDGTQVERHLFPGPRRAYKLRVAEAALAIVARWLEQRAG